MAIDRSSAERVLRADLDTLAARRAEAVAEHRDAITRHNAVRIRALRDELARIDRRHGEILRELPRRAADV